MADYEGILICGEVVVDRTTTITMELLNTGRRLCDDLAQPLSVLLIGRDIYFDTSYTFDLCPDDRIERMMRAHSIDRIIWGSDFPWQSQRQCVAGMERLGLSDDEKRAIYSENLVGLLRDP